MKKIALLLAIFTIGLQSVMAQTKEITGTVTSSDDGSSMPGVTVSVKGTTLGTITDFEGAYEIRVPQEASTLVFSFVGMQTLEAAISGSIVNVELEQDVVGLSEVVVTALGIQKEKKALGYSVGEVGAELLQNKPEVDISAALTGKIAGVNIIKSTGVVGSGSSINIRGNSSINGSNQPLFVVDGVPFDASTNEIGEFSSSGGSNNMFSSRFLDLDPNNIESVSVLKGLSAANLYGEQGRNGVIIITTKAGAGAKVKGLQISVSQSLYVNQVAGLPDYQNTYGQGGDNAASVGYVGNWGAKFSDNITVDHHYNLPRFASSFPEYQGEEVLYQAYPDNVKDFFQNGFGSNTYLNLSQGFDNGSVNFNLGYTDEDGYIPKNNVNRINVGFGANMQKGKLSVSGGLNFVRTDYKTPPFSASDASGAVTILYRLLFIPRNLDLMGLPYQDPYTGSNVYYRTDQDNPLWLLDNSAFGSVTDRVYGNAKFGFDILDNLNLSYQIGLDTYNDNARYYINKGGVASTQATQGFLRDLMSSNTIWNHNLLLNFDELELADGLKFDAQAGAQIRQDIYETNGIASSQQLVFGILQHDNFKTSSSVDPVTGTFLNYESKENQIGVFGQVGLDYRNYAYLTIAGRNDWGSTVEKENRSLFYPSVSMSFLPTSAFSSLESNTLNYLKIRAAYASSAGFPDPYLTRSAYILDPASFDDGNGSQPSVSESDRLGNPELKPELHKEFEIGIESNLFNNKIDLEATYYYRVSEDQIVNKRLDPSSGYSNTWTNVGRVDNWGVELNLGLTLVQTSDVTWKLNNIFTATESEVKDLEEQIMYNGFTNLGNFAIEGKPLGVIVGTYAAKLESLDDPENAYVDSRNFLVNATDGFVIDSEDLGWDNLVIGDPNPDWKYTAINTVSYKNFTLLAQIDYVHGGDFYSSTITSMLRRGVTKDTEDRDGSWIIPGYLADANTGKLILGDDGNPIENEIQIGTNDLYFLNTQDPSGQGIYDASVVRLREVSLSYNLPNNILRNTPFSSVSCTVSGQNLWYYAPNVPEYTNFDPETISTGVGNGLGLEFGSAPSSRKFAFTIKASF